MCFHQGFPGYDVNLDARKRAQDRAKAEMEAEKAKGEGARLFRSPRAITGSCTVQCSRRQQRPISSYDTSVVPLP